VDVWKGVRKRGKKNEKGGGNEFALVLREKKKEGQIADLWTNSGGGKPGGKAYNR